MEGILKMIKLVSILIWKMLIITKQGSLPLRIWMIMMDDDDIYDNNNKININNNNDNLKTKWVTVNEKCSSTAAKLIKKVKRGRERERERERERAYFCKERCCSKEILGGESRFSLHNDYCSYMLPKSRGFFSMDKR